MEHAYYLRQYLMRYPEKAEKVVDLLQRGYFECGAFYFGPTELTAGGESLIRELYLGKRWLKEKLNIDSKVVWNVDCPGHTQQLPQILKQAGVPYLIIWKEFNLFEHDYSGYKGPYLFRFAAPDGSEVASCFTPGGYGVGRMLGFRDSFEELHDRLPGFLDDVAAHLEDHCLPKIIMIADGTDVERPTLAVPRNIRGWNEKYKYPQISLATAKEFFDQVDPGALPVSRGEAPNWWDTIGSFQNERVMGERRCEPRQAAAEAFSAVAAQICEGYEYPHSLLERIWENRLYASEHNSGGRNGHISDAVKLSKVRSARVLTDIVLNQAMAEVALHVNFLQKGIPVLLFNSLMWSRKDLASINLHFQSGQMHSVRVIDQNGDKVPTQIESIDYYEDGSIKDCALQISFDLPGLGYETVYLVEGQEVENDSPVLLPTTGGGFENSWFLVTFDKASGFPISLINKNSGEELLSTGNYSFGELVTLENIAHDEDEHLTGNSWQGSQFSNHGYFAENGDLRATWIVEGDFKGGRHRTHFRFFKDLPRVDILVELDWQGEPDLQVMQAFPFKSSAESQIHYGVPFGFTRFGGENPDWTKVHPSVRGVRDWVHIGNGQQGLTLASEVIPFDFQDRIIKDEQGVLLQPILLKTTYSCHDQLEYLGAENIDIQSVYADSQNASYPRPQNPEVRWDQTGDHHYHFSIQVDTNGFDPASSTRFAFEHQTPIFDFIHYQQQDQFPHLIKESILNRLGDTTGRTFPERMIFMENESRNIIPTWVKQAEDGKGIVVRLFEACGKKSDAKITMNWKIDQAIRTDIIEYDKESLPINGNTLNLSLAPFKIETIRIMMADGVLQKGNPPRNDL
jgi:alpha-mannosidase